MRTNHFIVCDVSLSCSYDLHNILWNLFSDIEINKLRFKIYITIAIFENHRVMTKSRSDDRILSTGLAC